MHCTALQRLLGEVMLQRQLAERAGTVQARLAATNLLFTTAARCPGVKLQYRLQLLEAGYQTATAQQAQQFANHNQVNRDIISS